jgi:hypothetical protein
MRILRRYDTGFSQEHRQDSFSREELSKIFNKDQSQWNYSFIIIEKNVCIRTANYNNSVMVEEIVDLEKRHFKSLGGARVFGDNVEKLFDLVADYSYEKYMELPDDREYNMRYFLDTISQDDRDELLLNLMLDMGNKSQKEKGREEK